jgi:hypothetical protein
MLDVLEEYLQSATEVSRFFKQIRSTFGNPMLLA